MLAWLWKLHHCSWLHVLFHGRSTQMKPSRIFRLSRIPSTFHFVELPQLVIPTTSPPGEDRHFLFSISIAIFD
jgi:hypothetical protein